MASDNPFANLGLGMMGGENSYARQGMNASDGSTGAILLNSLFGTDLPITQEGLKEYKTGIVTGIPPTRTPNRTQPLQQQDQTTAPTTGVFRKFLDFIPKQ